MVDNKIQRQLELEEEAVSLGVKKYRDHIQKLKRNHAISESESGVSLVYQAIEPMVTAIKEFKESKSWGGKLFHTKKFFMMFEDEVLAFITAKHCINYITSPTYVQRVSILLANMLKDQLEYERFKAENPAFLFKVESNLNTNHQGHKRAVIMRAKRILGIADESWSEQDKLHIGTKLIDLFIESTGLVELQRTPDGIFLVATEKVSKWLVKAEARCELMHPLYLPMLVQPKEWDSPFGGGFISNIATMRHKIIKTRNTKALMELGEIEMPEVYKAINTVQNTGWRINKNVLKVLKEAWESKSFLGGLPNSEFEDLPPKAWTTDEEYSVLKQSAPEVIKQWKRQASAIYDRRHREESKRYGIAMKIWIAEKFLEEKELFFCWTLDWRGRLYPVQSYINPQADDTGKALLEFSEGKPLGERGAYWLKIHLANEFGFDKEGFGERLKWTEEHEALILDSATNPLDGQRFWSQADNPYRFLAACFEYQGYKIFGISFESHLPISLDGTCNGLQNFSAMLFDELGGRAVNLIPLDKPADVYDEVAKTVSKMVEQDARDGNELAKLWLGKVTRQIAKRNVMTLPYGAKKFGMKNQLLTELINLGSPAQPYLDTDDPFQPCVYLAEKMYEGIGKVVVSAQRVMDWLQEVSKRCAKVDMAIEWTTPIGFRVHQEYIKQKMLSVNTFWGGIRIQLSLFKDTKKMNKTKMSNGISPNFVHSMDASHLMLTVNKCLSSGVTSFSVVHDSYGVHASCVDTLTYCLRDAFIEQYNLDVLAKFKEEVEKQLGEELPPLPEKGNLDLEVIRDSEYFFA